MRSPPMTDSWTSGSASGGSHWRRQTAAARRLVVDTTDALLADLGAGAHLLDPTGACADILPTVAADRGCRTSATGFSAER